MLRVVIVHVMRMNKGKYDFIFKPPILTHIRIDKGI